MKVVFVCTGNTCRSSMAEALARKWLKAHPDGVGNIELASAGLAAAGPGSPASPRAVEVMGAAGIDLTGHRARQFCHETARESDLILTMTGNHKRTLVALYPGEASKVFTLAEFAGKSGLDISDPFGLPVAIYKQCAREIEELVDIAFHKILKQAP